MFPRARYECFGGIVATQDPPALVYVDQQAMRSMGYADSPLWHGPARHLTAPTEVHYNVTRRCTLGCRHCTSAAGPDAGVDLSRETIEAGIEVLARMGVFHVAFGGGELMLRSDWVELARHARRRGLVPNATTNGQVMSAAAARACTIFGQVNVSVDGIGDGYGAVRGCGSFELAEQALRRLVEAGVSAGVNCVVTRANFEQIEQVVAWADRMRLKEVLLLRLKPSGRAAEVYRELALTARQGAQLYPMLRRLAARYRPALQMDCSFVPHLCAHRPSKRAMRLLGVEGCGAGDMLLGVSAEGAVNACSHHPEAFGNVQDLPVLWERHEHFRRFRERKVTDPRCAQCRYFPLCRGGCPLMSQFIIQDFDAPDPECPVLASS